jgi:hypothetical protein
MMPLSMNQWHLWAIVKNRFSVVRTSSIGELEDLMIHVWTAITDVWAELLIAKTESLVPLTS